MKWIVLEENPKADNYIAVVLSDRFKKLQVEKKAHAVFENVDDALKRARELRNIYGVKTIKLFQL
ncbi:MAG: hypothetical protein KF687_16415 [Cyclobacteriaceae bacterium]|nr:hypothetical protein [Cyclobacteriaceae bacterium]